MSLPKQFVNDVHKGEDILFCPYCSRILFFEEIEMTESLIGADEAGSLSDLVSPEELELED